MYYNLSYSLGENISEFFVFKVVMQVRIRPDPDPQHWFKALIVSLFNAYNDRY